jgi:CRISPR-associated endonuclease Csy4
MRAYLEITVLPNPEVNIHFLWSKVFQQLHLALVEVQDPQNQVAVGVSFPEYVVGDKYSILGSKCRLFAPDQATLERLNISQWLARLADYVHVTSIRPVPEKVSIYAIYQRQQVKTNPERLARRYARRHGVMLEQAMQHYQTMAAVRVATPFIRLQSLSSEHTFCLWIKKTEVPHSVTGVFSTYGLSAQTTVPEF